VCSKEVTEKCTDTVENWLPGILSKALKMLAKAYHCPGELLRRKCVNRYKVPYFCAINQFQNLFEASSIMQFYFVLQLWVFTLMSTTCICKLSVRDL
jgi:hypothetical protein